MKFPVQIMQRNFYEGGKLKHTYFDITVAGTTAEDVSPDDARTLLSMLRQLLEEEKGKEERP